MKHFKLSDFDYDLPQELIATHPTSPRDHARMLVASLDGEILDKQVKNLTNFLNPGDLIIFNNSKVIPAKLIAKTSLNGSKIQINLHKNIENNVWSAFAKPGKKLKINDLIMVEDQKILIRDKLEDGQVILDFSFLDESFDSFIHKHGITPLPPYIEKLHQTTHDDKELYQTIFAQDSGSVAAPTAGLHFTEQLLQALQNHGVNYSFITLHVGGGTFLPVKTDNINEHKMHSEYAIISSETANLINHTKAQGNKVIAVGTTSARLLEASCDSNDRIIPSQNWVDIFITPGYKFKVVDILLTNFHLPKSTLLMLVSAFAGYNEIRDIYKHAIEQQYRFYSYGDCCLLHLKKEENV